MLVTRSQRGSQEVFLVERSKELKFFGGYHSLPGGVLDPADGGAADSDDAPAERCALREVFEEIGILPSALAGSVSDEERRSLRHALLRGERGGWDALLSRAAPRRPLLIGRITTPPFAPVRYDTNFYHLPLPAGERPEVIPGELTSGAFWTPENALRSWRMGEVLIAPPALLLLRCLEGNSIKTFLSKAREEAEALLRGRLHPVYFTPGVLMAPLESHTKPPATTTNTYLVGETRIYVVDPAPARPAEQARLFDTLDRALASGAKLEGALLTHEHPDHTGALKALSDRYGIPWFAHPEALRRLRSSPANGHAIENGARFELGAAPDGAAGWRLDAIHAPGHAPGHLVFQESRYRALLVGDVLSTLSSVVIDPEDGGHMATYVRTLSRLLDLPLGTIYPGHGPAARDGRALIRGAIDHRRAREAKLISALRPAPQPVEEILRAVYDDVAEEMRSLARASLHAGLIKLKEEGKARQIGGNWRRA